MMSSAEDDRLQSRRRSLIQWRTCLGQSTTRTSILVLLLVHHTSSWRVLENNNIDTNRHYNENNNNNNHLNHYKNLTWAAADSVNDADARPTPMGLLQQELGQSGWRFLTVANSIPSSARYQQATRGARASGSNHREKTDANIVSLAAASEGVNQTKRFKSDAPIEWDDEGAEDEDDRNELTAAKNDRAQYDNSSSSVEASRAPADSYRLLGQPIGVSGVSPKAIDPLRFELKDSAQNSINKIKHVSPYQLSGNLKHSDKYYASNQHQHYRSFGPNSIGASKLIFHGQLAANNDSKLHKRFVAGIEMQIDTHKPIVINRRSFSAPLTSGSSSPPMAATTNMTTTSTVSSSSRDPFMFRTGASTQTSADVDRDGDMSSTRATLKSNSLTTTTTTSSTTETSIRSGPPSPLLFEVGSSSLSASSNISQELGSSSDWRPIVVSARTRRSGKTQISALFPGSDSSKWDSAGNKSAIQVSKSLNELAKKLDTKWKPITGGHRLMEAKLSSTLDVKKIQPPAWTKSHLLHHHHDRLMSKEFRSSSKKSLDISRKIEQPFDRDDDEDERQDERDDDEFSNTRDTLDTNGVSPRLSSDRWTPLETTTANGPDALMSSGSTTTISSVEPSSMLANTTQQQSSRSSLNATSSSENAQRSASDLSYIYSSQPAYGGSLPQQQQQVQQSPTGSSSYYGNYLVPSQQTTQQQPQVDLPPQITPTIIDTTSGQTPEMVPERAPIEQPVPQSQYDYSSFQSVQASPSRQPAYYGNYGGGSNSVSSSGFGQDPSTGYYQPARALPAQQPTRQSQPNVSPQILKQEHHYHYYNQPSSSLADRQRSLGERNQPVAAQPTPSPQPMVIRELQPIMISQPVVQQQASSTTQAPQIIREIIKEVPVQTMQVQPIQMPTRFVMQQQQVPVPPLPQPVIPPIPASFIRDGSFDSFGSYEAPAKRFMRQITESMPQVAIRMPSAPQFRLQVPAIQLPAPLRVSPPAAVTRQTGSFIVPPMPKKTTTLMTETQEIPLHTTIIHSTQYTPATRTTVYTTDHQPSAPVRSSSSYKR